MRRRAGSRGQAAVEFTLFTFFLFLMLLLIVQLMVIGIQKWQFVHFASYSARVWSVQKDDSAQDSTTRAQLVVSVVGWKLLGNQWVAPIRVKSENTSRSGVTGNVYEGIGPVMSMYRGWIGERFGLPDFVNFRPLEFFIFESFIPMVKEPTERPGRHDNDCNETPCESGNKR